MSIFLQTDAGDFAIVNNALALTDGPQEVLQLIRNNLRMFQGEEPLDTALGVPYFQQILDKSTPIATSQAVLESVVRNTAGVTDVVGFTLSLDRTTRKATVSFTAVTDGGNVTTTETFP